MTTQTEALKLARRAINNLIASSHLTDPQPWRDARQDSVDALVLIEEALAQPEQEPVAWLHWTHGPVRLFLNKDEAMMELDRLNREYPVDKDARQMKPLYTTPPQRTWVGLSREDCYQVRERESDAFMYGVAWAEAKLKEKNK